MTNYAYTDNVPASQNNPSVDQPKMKTNSKSIKDLIGEDHYTFGVNNGGFHKQVRMPALALIGNVAPRISNSGTLWTHIDTSEGASNETNLHYIPGTGANDYQLTRCIAGRFAQFSTFATYGTPPAGVTWSGGWTFLPGGLLLQYGLVTPSANSVTVTFPVPYSTVVFSVTATMTFIAIGGTSVTLGTNNQTTTTFDVNMKNGSTRFMWMAIGK